MAPLILQRLGRGPARFEFAVRVVEKWDRHTPNGLDAGFTYVTLEGHPERGTETVRAELGPDFVELYAPEDARDHPHYDTITAEWARQWSVEEIWRAAQAFLIRARAAAIAGSPAPGQ